MPDSTAISVYIVEDNEVTRSVIREIISAQKDLTLAGESGDGELAVREIVALKPNVVLVDLGLPGLDGIQILKLVKAQSPQTRAIMLSSHDSESSMFEAFAAGAQAYFSKNDFHQANLIKAISEVHAGASWIDSTTAQQMIQSIASQDPEKLEGLSDDQKRILLLVAEKSDPKEADDLPPARKEIENVAADKLESDVPVGDWNLFLKRLQKFKK